MGGSVPTDQGRLNLHPDNDGGIEDAHGANGYAAIPLDEHRLNGLIRPSFIGVATGRSRIENHELFEISEDLQIDFHSAQPLSCQ